MIELLDDDEFLHKLADALRKGALPLSSTADECAARLEEIAKRLASLEDIEEDVARGR